MTASPRSQPDNGRDPAVQLGTEDVAALVHRLRRAEGQIAGVIRMLEEGRDCRDVLTQVAARVVGTGPAGFAIIASGLRRCLANPNEPGTVDPTELEGLVLSLA